jgi:hypothetical protein
MKVTDWLHSTGHFHPKDKHLNIHWIQCWVGPRAGPETMLSGPQGWSRYNAAWAPGMVQIQCWVGPRVGPDPLENRKLFPLKGIQPQPLGHPASCHHYADVQFWFLNAHRLCLKPLQTYIPSSHIQRQSKYMAYCCTLLTQHTAVHC